MKKVFFFIGLSALLVLLLAACMPDYTGWQMVSIDGIGSLKVPGSWFFTQQDDTVYFTNKSMDEKDFGIYLLHVKITLTGDVKNEIASNTIIGELQVHDVSSAVLSNGAEYGQEGFEIEGEKEKKYFIEVRGKKRYLHLVAWDNLVDKDTIKKIAQSFIPQ